MFTWKLPTEMLCVLWHFAGNGGRQKWRVVFKERTVKNVCIGNIITLLSVIKWTHCVQQGFAAREWSLKKPCKDVLIFNRWYFNIKFKKVAILNFGCTYETLLKPVNWKNRISTNEIHFDAAASTWMPSPPQRQAVNMTFNLHNVTGSLVLDCGYCL